MIIKLFTNSFQRLLFQGFTFFIQVKHSLVRFINKIVSNRYFSAFQKQMAIQLSDKNYWNDRCWHLIKLFQFFNQSFQISQMDIIVSFIQQNTLRKTLGHFRLWIDLERLYMFSFLKLDRMQFQQERIFMTLYRTMLFVCNFFTEYCYNDFDPAFIKKFCNQSVILLQKLMQFLSKQTKYLAQCIITILKNFLKNSPQLIKPSILEQFKREVNIKIAQCAETIVDVQKRLQSSVEFQQKIQQNNKLRLFLNMTILDSITKQVEQFYDPRIRIIKQQENKRQQHHRIDQQFLNLKLAQFEKQFQTSNQDNGIYQTLQKTSHNPYQQTNYSIFGQFIGVDLKKKKQLQKVQQKQIISKDQKQQLKIYYQQDYLKKAINFDQNLSKVTKKDLSLNYTMKNADQNSKNSIDDQNKIFNLKYGYNDIGQISDKKTTIRDYDNNILFKNQLDDYVQTSKNKLTHLMTLQNCKTKTFLDYNQRDLIIHPNQFKGSFGPEMFSNNKQPQLFDFINLRSINRNKFDQIRKIIQYLVAQKKIKKIINQKNIPDYYPRNYQDNKRLSYNPQLSEMKIKFQLGQTKVRPRLIL